MVEILQHALNNYLLWTISNYMPFLINLTLLYYTMQSHLILCYILLSQTTLYCIITILSHTIPYHTLQILLYI